MEYIRKMQKNYKFGISTTVDMTVDIFTQLDIFSRFRLDFISLCARPEHSHIYDSETFADVLKRVADCGFFIESAHFPFWEGYDPAARELSDREKAVGELKKYMAWMSANKIPIVIIHPHYYFEGSKEACFERAAGSIEKALAEKPDDIRLVIENLPTAAGSWICENLLETFDNSRVGFCYDSSHENMSGEPFHLLKKYYNRLTTTHLSDNHGESDEHLVPGDGTIDWRRMREFLDKSPLENILFEVGTGKKLAEPVADFVRRTAEAVGLIFEQNI